MERHKEIERDRMERERQAQQQEREQCNAEQAVTKHFEESLRRAKEKVSEFCVLLCLAIVLVTPILKPKDFLTQKYYILKSLAFDVDHKSFRKVKMRFYTF